MFPESENFTLEFSVLDLNKVLILMLITSLFIRSEEALLSGEKMRTMRFMSLMVMQQYLITALSEGFGSISSLIWEICTTASIEVLPIALLRVSWFRQSARSDELWLSATLKCNLSPWLVIATWHQHILETPVPLSLASHQSCRKLSTIQLA